MRVVWEGGVVREGGEGGREVWQGGVVREV